MAVLTVKCSSKMFIATALENLGKKDESVLFG
jgi:hypothetical protein